MKDTSLKLSISVGNNDLVDRKDDNLPHLDHSQLDKL